MTPLLETYQDIGAYLRDCRESMRVSIERASKELHIRAKYLEAMEAGNVKALPSGIYARGYIQQYADYLRLDSAMLLRAYDEASGRIKRDTFFVPEPTRKHNMPSSRVILISLALILVLYGLWLSIERKSEQTAIATVQELPERYERILNPPPLVVEPRWRSCFLLVENPQAMCQTIEWAENPTYPASLMDAIKGLSFPFVKSGNRADFISFPNP